MNYEKRNCEECGEAFTPKGKNQYGIQKFCSKKCKKKNDNLKYYIKKSKATLSPTLKEAKATLKDNYIKKTQKRTLKQEVADVQQFLYNIKNGDKVITQFKELAEKTINTMQLIKLDTYSDSVKAVCIDIMKNLSLFLQNQLKIEKDRGVIIVQAE